MARSRRRLAKAIGVSIGSVALFAVVTGLLPNSLYVRMVPRTGLDYLFLLLTGGFLGLYTYQRSPRRQGDDTTATVSAVVGVLAFGCPVCNAVLLALFSSSALITYFDTLRPLLGAVSVVLFGWLLYVRSRRGCDACAGRPSGSRTD